MVKVREEHPINDDGSVNVEQWLSRLPVDSDTDKSLLRKACETSFEAEQRSLDISDKAWAKTTSSFIIGLEMAEMLAGLHLDEDTLIAAILYRSVREDKLTAVQVKRDFGATVAHLIDGVLRMAAMSNVISSDSPVLGQAEAQKDTIRKMLVALVDDVRVALIKLAERTCAIRAVKNNSEKRQRVAREVYDIYAPLAHRLGIGHIKWELEDLSFRFLHNDAYKKIAKLLDEKRLDRQRFIDEVIDTLNHSLAKVNIKGDITGRAKHIYSIWRKMQRKAIGFSQVYDIRAVRILVPEIQDCYAVLGLVHGLWRNIPNEFDDYIANPKDNGYRSLHTAVIGPEGKVLEIQIRTQTMHEEAEFGVCAHWLYKGSDNHGTNSYENKITWLRQVLDWQEEMGSSATVAEQFAGSQDRIYVFTPDGHVVSLAQGSTPLDFAYHIHTEVGHRCRGAKVNGRIVPLTYVLKTGEQVEILTGKENAPRRDWLQPGLAYLQSSRARAKVQQWFKLQAKEDNVSAGRTLIEKICKRLALTSLDYKAVANYFGYQAVEDMYAAAGAGDISAAQIINAVQSLFEQPPSSDLIDKVSSSRHAPIGEGITVRGVGNMLTRFAACCKPLPGDAITGYVTVGRGVSIHRQDCAKALQLHSSEPERVIEVEWGVEARETYPVDIEIEAYDRSGLLRDITTLLANAHIDVLAINTESDKRRNIANMRLTVEIVGLESLGNLLAKLSRLPNVLNAQRIREGGSKDNAREQKQKKKLMDKKE